MTPLDRMASLFASILLLTVGLLLIATTIGWNPANALGNLAEFLVNNRLLSLLFSIILILPGLQLLFFATLPDKEEGIVNETSLGQVRISLKALENLVIRTAKDIKGVKDVEAEINAVTEGAEVAVSLIVLPDYKIPDVSEEVQKRVEGSIRETAGLPVNGVTVEVRNVAEPHRPRVE